MGRGMKRQSDELIKTWMVGRSAVLVNIQRVVLQEKEPRLIVFPRREHAHHGQFQTTNATAPSVKLERDVHNWFLGSCELV